MSSPTSVKLAPPAYVDPRVRRKHIIEYIIQIWLSCLPAAFLLYWFFYAELESFLPFSSHETLGASFSFRGMISNWGWDIPGLIFSILIPFILIAIYIITVVWAALITKFYIFILNLNHKPIEGVFYRSLDDKDYVYWNRRNLSRIFLHWLLFSVPFTFLKKTFAYRIFGIKIGKHTDMNHCWVSPEFMEIGDNVKIGQAAGIYSFQFEGDKLLVAKVIIKDDVLIGPQAVIFPGTKVNDGVTIDGGCFADPFTEYESNGVYHGTPAKLIRYNNKGNHQ
ncbi:MAG: acyltransferase [Promethearchaeota archaeon]